MIPFDEIKTVLLDMDGTILDKYFDDYFWEIHVPQKYAEKEKISFEDAQRILFSMYKAEEGTLNWTDIDFWTKKTGLDIFKLKKEVEHLINPHPDAEEFLKTVSSNGKRLYLLTNAHNKVMDLKLKKTGFYKYFHGVFTSFDMGYPKEKLEFWQRLREKVFFEPEYSIFVDDTEEILHTAKLSGIKLPILRGISSSRNKPKKSENFFTIMNFQELINL
ncbi:MAG: HAD-IA family hydrolase [Thermodesulfovibrio sp.]|nr:HAD-IA family hydrolase [Thermodesulfovibrio sp.]MDW7997867.1 HAD-IA family hydrolase [Thermodesulfovibrio sp.]